jgi:hypothetical protein
VLNEVVFTWDDNGNNENGFIVERKINQGGWREVGRTGRDETIARLKYDQYEEYCYRVRAYNDHGKSAPSNTDCNQAKPGGKGKDVN